MRAPLLIIFILAIAPAVSAGWISHSQREPDTAADDSAARIWLDAPERDTGRVYFHAYPTLAESGINPNVGTLGSRHRVVSDVRWEAVLGVWADCNDDATIGQADGALEVYPTALLLASDRCPPGSAHNDGTQVQELLTLGPNGDINDEEALVWGDFGVPGAGGLEACRVAPLPRGTTSNTGRLLRVLDCAAEHRLVGAVNTVDNDGSLGLRIDDIHNPERSDSRLVRNTPVNAFGNPMNGQRGLLDQEAPAAFSSGDCGAVAPSLSADPTNASLWAGAASTSDQLAGDCDPGTGAPIDPAYAEVEAPFEPTSHTGRDQNDMVFALGGPSPSRVTLEPWTAFQLAVAPDTTSAPKWRAIGSFVMTPQILARGNVAVAGATSFTFYAHVGEAVYAHGLELPSGGSLVYGAEACGSEASGRYGGWVCDMAAWWRDPAGDAMPRDGAGRALGARVGQPYELRDVDCDDGALARGSGIFLSAAIVGGACIEPASA